MWSEGTIKVGNSVFHYWVKHYDEPSHYGIGNGRISKLTLKRNGMVVYNYDTEMALAILIRDYN